MSNRRWMVVAALSGLIVVGLASCRGDRPDQQAAAGTVDVTTGAVSAVGPGIQVTRTDAASVRAATQYKLTDQNFTNFLHAADSVAALIGRDSAVRRHLTQPIADAGSPTLDAGVLWIESDTAVSRAINAAGVSPRDYFVMGIAIAGAEQHMASPNTAPPTPAAKDNAEFLRAKSADLARLHAMEKGKPSVVVTP